MSGETGWRPVPGWPGYFATEEGQIVSTRRGEPYTLIGSRNLRGYRIIRLCGGAGVSHTRTVHRVIAEAFLGPMPPGTQVRHLDGNRENNTPSNLAYGTRSENMQDQVRHGVHYMARKTHCKRGHLFDEENTYRGAGKRDCRTCRQAAARRARHNAKAGVR